MVRVEQYSFLLNSCKNSHSFSRPTYNEYNIDNNVEERLAENHQEDECGTQADARERAADLGSAQFRSQHKWVPLGRDGCGG